MKELEMVIVKRCIKIIIMLFPSLLWASLVMLDIYIGVSHMLFNILTYMIMGTLFFTILFSNTILKIDFDKDSFEHMHYEFIKPNRQALFKGFITGMPLLIILFLTPIWFFLLYGLIQFFYIIADKDHMSIMERLYTLSANGTQIMIRWLSEKKKQRI